MKVYTPNEVADVLKVEPVTIRRWLMAGKMSGFKVGKEWRVTEEDIQQFIENNRPKREKQA